LPLQIEPGVQNFFNSSITIKHGDGSIALFWTDNCLDAQAIVAREPTLCLAVSKRIKQAQIVAQALTNKKWIREIKGGLSVQAIVEYLQLLNRLDSVQLQSGTPNQIIWRWTSTGEYTGKSAYYKMLHQGSIRLHGHKLIWKTWVPLIVKLFRLRLNKDTRL
jgi:GH35 family endo-1,4-beta-xylanase